MKTYIWTLPTRLFHWLLALSFTVAFIVAGEEEYLNLHAALGIMIGSLVLFRIIQGINGPRFTRFSDFPVTPGQLKLFITRMGQTKEGYAGHNPLASLVMLSIFATALLSAATGILMIASGDKGFFGLRFGSAVDMEFLEEAHDILVHLLLVLAGVHITGVIVDTLFHREQRTLLSIFTGYKKIRAAAAELTFFQKGFSIIWFAISLLIFYYVLVYQPLQTGKKTKTEQVEQKEEED